LIDLQKIDHPEVPLTIKNQVRAMNQTEAIERAKEHFARLLEAQLKRVD